MTNWYRPQTKEELFNLRHASARNIIERIFGVLKRRFRILQLAPEYNLNIQARIPASLCTIHNFILSHDPQEGSQLPQMVDYSPDSSETDSDDGNHTQMAPNTDSNEYHANAKSSDGRTSPHSLRDHIAQSMWTDYQRILRERMNESLESDGTDNSLSQSDKILESSSSADSDKHEVSF